MGLRKQACVYDHDNFLIATISKIGYKYIAIFETIYLRKAFKNHGFVPNPVFLVWTATSAEPPLRGVKISGDFLDGLPFWDGTLSCI